jgi:hypothetical protein
MHKLFLTVVLHYIKTLELRVSIPAGSSSTQDASEILNIRVPYHYSPISFTRKSLLFAFAAATRYTTDKAPVIMNNFA